MIALFGTELERTAMRREINEQHQMVRSGRDSAIPYDAFDPELQLWVAACMFRGVVDAVTFLNGPVDDVTYNVLLSTCARFGLALQVSEEQWPSDRARFEAYWSSSLSKVTMDDTTRPLLRGIASLDFLPTPFARVLGPSHRFLTTGFLPSPFREELGLPWSPRRQVRFEKIVKFLGALHRRLPLVVREFPWNLIELDTKRRIARGRSVL
jgi:uncharacterized protein (DUF2236 family)